MKHVLLILVALLVAGAGVLILVLSKCATTAAILSGVGLIVLALALSIPAQLKLAVETVAPYVPLIKGPGQGGSP